MAYSSDPALQSNQLPISYTYPAYNSPEFEDGLNNTYKRIADAVNTKEGALYILNEEATFQLYFTAGNPQVTRPVYRVVVDFGALPNAGVKTVAHNIAFTNQFTSTRIYGSATDPAGLFYLPLPYASPTLNKNIELSLDGTNVIITTGINLTAFTRTTIVIEFLKNL
jgi:hypothetical protein